MNKKELRDKVLSLANPARNGLKEAQDEIIQLHKEEYGRHYLHERDKSPDFKLDLHIMIQHLLK